MSKWLDQLRTRRTDFPPIALTKLTKAPSVSSVSAPGEGSQKNDIVDQYLDMDTLPAVGTDTPPNELTKLTEGASVSNVSAAGEGLQKNVFADKHPDMDALPADSTGGLPAQSGVAQGSVNTAPAPIALLDEMLQAIATSTLWSDLDAILEKAQQQYQAGELTAAQVEELAQRTADRARVIPAEVPPARLSALLQENPIQHVHSRVLGEKVILAADSAKVGADMEGVVYRESELRLMPGRSPEQVCAIHRAKCAIDGELIEPPGQEVAVPTEELLQRAQTDVDACQICGKVAWWYQASGERICGVCHPKPQQNRNRKEAALACVAA